MKFLHIIIVFLFLSVLSSCFDTEENIVINEDNSGTYTNTMDMGKLIGMANMMRGEDITPERKLDKIDSVIYLKEMIATADSLTAAEKELYKDATIRIKIDKANAEMKIIMSCPFRSIEQLPEIRNNFMIVMNKIKVFDKISGKDGEASDKNEDMDLQKGFTPNAVPFSFIAVPGRIENSITDVRSIKDIIQSDSTMIMMKQMTAMIGTPTYITVITTPREIRLFSGNSATLSNNKKTVTFTNTFTDLIEQPDKMAFKVEY